MPARHALQAVLAAGERRLDEDEEHQLRQSQRDHGEVDALPADRQHAEQRAEHRRGQGAGEDAQLGAESAVAAQHVACDIAAGGEERRMAEGQQTRVASSSVEGAGEQREAQQLHQEHRVHRQRRQQRSPAAPHRRFSAAAHAGARAPRWPAAPRPPGYWPYSSCSCLLTKESRRTNQQHRHHDQKHHGVRRFRIEDLGQPSIRPMAIPVTMAPRIEPMPPITTTANTTISRFEPMPGVTA